MSVLEQGDLWEDQQELKGSEALVTREEGKDTPRTTPFNVRVVEIADPGAHGVPCVRHSVLMTALPDPC